MDVTLDPRPLAVQEQELEEAKALTRRKLAHQLEASDLALHKMFSRNVIQLDVFPFTLKAIRLVKTHFAMFDIFNIGDKKSLVSSSDYIICLYLLYNMICFKRDPEIMIRPLRQKNLSKAFFDQLEEVHQKMAEASLRGR